MWQAERARIDMRSKEVDRICDEMIDYFGHRSRRRTNCARARSGCPT